MILLIKCLCFPSQKKTENFDITHKNLEIYQVKLAHLSLKIFSNGIFRRQQLDSGVVPAFINETASDDNIKQPKTAHLNFYMNSGRISKRATRVSYELAQNPYPKQTLCGFLAADIERFVQKHKHWKTIISGKNNSSDERWYWSSFSSSHRPQN